MDQHNILRLSDLNLAEFIREMARWNRASRIIEEDDLILTKGVDGSPVINVAISLGMKGGPSGAETMKRIQTFYEKEGSGFSVHVRRHLDSRLEEACRSEKMHRISEPPGMIIDKPVPDSPLPEGVEIRPISDPAGAADFAAVAIDSFQSLGMPRETGALIFAEPERCLSPHSHIVAAYLEGRPVSCAMALMSHSIAGVYWVGTIKDARGKGIAGACTAAVTNKALERGAPFVVLQASKFGEPVYRRMGFREFTKYPWYMRFRKG